jgi:hypothetical protein
MSYSHHPRIDGGKVSLYPKTIFVIAFKMRRSPLLNHGTIDLECFFLELSYCAPAASQKQTTGTLRSWGITNSGVGAGKLRESLTRKKLLEIPGLGNMNIRIQKISHG